jgi:hypothetical protein
MKWKLLDGGPCAGIRVQFHKLFEWHKFALLTMEGLPPVLFDPENKPLSRGAEGDGFPPGGALADLKKPLKAADVMNDAKLGIEASDNAGIGFAGFASLGRKNGCWGGVR